MRVRINVEWSGVESGREYLRTGGSVDAKPCMRLCELWFVYENYFLLFYFHSTCVIGDPATRLSIHTHHSRIARFDSILVLGYTAPGLVPPRSCTIIKVRA